MGYQLPSTLVTCCNTRVFIIKPFISLVLNMHSLVFMGLCLTFSTISQQPFAPHADLIQQVVPSTCYMMSYSLSKLNINVRNILW